MLRSCFFSFSFFSLSTFLIHQRHSHIPQRHFFHELSMWLNAQSGRPTFHRAIIKRIWLISAPNKYAWRRSFFFELAMNQPPCIVALWRLSGQNKTSSISNIIMLIQVALMWWAVFPLNGGGRDLGMQKGLTSLTDPFLFLSSKKALKMRHQLQVYVYKDECSWAKLTFCTDISSVCICPLKEDSSPTVGQ